LWVNLWFEADLDLASAVAGEARALSGAFADNAVFVGDAFFNAGAGFEFSAIDAFAFGTDGLGHDAYEVGFG
jgi:hypothetical protein